LKAFLSWSIVFSLCLFWVAPFVNYSINDIPLLIILSLVIIGTCSILLIIILIKERLKDREEEKDALNKY
jgi:uncharacterized membrane protein YhaH (DUF805 family)